MIFSLTYFIRILSDFDIKATNKQIAFVIRMKQKIGTAHWILCTLKIFVNRQCEKKLKHQKHTRTGITLIDSSILVHFTSTLK
jgi:hypothetical protein